MPGGNSTSASYTSDGLGCTVEFNSYSDAKLMALYLDNRVEFSVNLFQKVLDVVIDPRFRPEEVTIKGVRDIFECVSTRRRQNKPTQSQMLKAIAPPPGVQPVGNAAPAPAYYVPLDVVSMVVDKMVEDRLPLGVAAAVHDWRQAYVANTADFCRMSLVHRSWTPIARRGLRRRAVIPYHRLVRFHLSPFCGPWITEMIIYWTVNYGPYITKDDVALLGILLERAPNVRSLSFNTSLVYYGRYSSRRTTRPLYESKCLVLIAKLLPNLESLLLKHFPQPDRFHYDPYDSEDHSDIQGQYTCSELATLYHQVPKMRSLKFLSVRSWSNSWLKRTTEAKEIPPPELEEAELDLGRETRSIAPLLKPQGRFRLRSLSIAIRKEIADTLFRPSNLHDVFRRFLSKLEKLRLYFLDTPSNSVLLFECRNIIKSCTELVSLDLFIVDSNRFDLQLMEYPPTLQRLAVRFLDTDLHENLSRSLNPEKSQRFIQVMQMHLPMLVHLQSLILTGVLDRKVDDVKNWDLDLLAYHLNKSSTLVKEGIPQELFDLCKEHHIELICFSDTFPRQ